MLEAMNKLKTAQEIFQELIDKGFSQTEIADYAGIKSSSVSRVLAGDQKDVMYISGKKIEVLNAKTRRRKS